MSENAGGALTTYSWDYENRLIGISSPNGVETYSYSADGMREEKENSSGTVYYVRDGDNVLIETDVNLITQAHYTDFPGVWGGLTSERRGSTSSFYAFDQQSNARILVSLAGAITDDYLYNAFGEEVAVLGATVNSLRYGGRVGYWRDEAERVYVRARNLRTDMGRWMSRDPIGFGGGDLNLYRYVKGNPLIAVDPSGYWCWHLRNHNCMGTSCHGDPYCKPAHKTSSVKQFIMNCLKIEVSLEFGPFNQNPPFSEGGTSMNNCIYQMCKLTVENTLLMWCHSDLNGFLERFGVELPPHLNIGINICGCIADAICKAQTNVPSVEKLCSHASNEGKCMDCCNNIKSAYGNPAGGIGLGCYDFCVHLPGLGY